jgi:hypothetical protein
LQSCGNNLELQPITLEAFIENKPQNCELFKRINIIILFLEINKNVPRSTSIKNDKINNRAIFG